MKTIYKYQIPIKGANIRCNLQLPKEAVILSFQCQDEVPTIWAEVENAHNDEERHFRLYGTGQAIENIPKNTGLHYIGTAQRWQGGLADVWHLVEEVKENV